MSVESINSMVDEITSDSNVTDASDDVNKPEIVEKAEEAQDAQDSKPQEEKTEEGDVEDNKPFPKKALNALSYRDKKIAKLNAEKSSILAEVEQLKQELARYKGGNAQPSEGGLREEDFPTYAEYLKAQAVEEALNKFKELNPQPQKSQEADPYIVQREQQIAQKAQEYKKTIPDYAQILDSHIEMIDALPEAVQHAFYEADDAALAFYNLAKSGDLASLAGMTPTQAAMAIAKASVRKPESAPPQHRPIAGAKGTGKSGKSLEDMSPAELMNWLNS